MLIHFVPKWAKIPVRRRFYLKAMKIAFLISTHGYRDCYLLVISIGYAVVNLRCAANCFLYCAVTFDIHTPEATHTAYSHRLLLL